MQKLQAFKFRIEPSAEQERQLRQFAGCRRFVFNKALALQKENHKNGVKHIKYEGMTKLLPKWKSEPETAWLADAPSQILQQAMKDLDKAYKRFFSEIKKKYRVAPEDRALRRKLKKQGVPLAYPPVFKKKSDDGGFRFPDPVQISLDQGANRIKLPKLGWVRYRNSRKVNGDLKNVTISQSCGKWYMSVQTEMETDQPVPTAASAIGIDMGITRFATMSDGTYAEPLNSFRKHEKRLKKYQKRMSRKVKFSQNWKKAKRRVQKIQSGIANARRDYLHKLSTTISKNHAMVAIEDLQINNMSKSSKGDAENPGKNVAAKSGLNKSILDQGWGEFRRQLEYKFQWNGGIVIAVPPQYTSQTCPKCGHVSKENRKTQAKFKCVCCGYENNADVVGAINILARGHRVIAWGEDGSGHAGNRRTKPTSVKQEPTGVTGPGKSHD